MSEEELHRRIKSVLKERLNLKEGYGPQEVFSKMEEVMGLIDDIHWILDGIADSMMREVREEPDNYLTEEYYSVARDIRKKKLRKLGSFAESIEKLFKYMKKEF